jgi:hypothetical protein
VKSALHDEQHENDKDEDRDKRVKGDGGSSQPPASGHDARAGKAEPAQEDLPGGETYPSFVWSARVRGHDTYPSRPLWTRWSSGEADTRLA